MNRTRLACTLALLAGMSFAMGCQTSLGALQPNTQFVYPNSNVKILGPVQASVTKSGVLGLNTMPSADEVRGTYDTALSQQQGANVIVNFEETTEFTTYLLWATTTYTIKGNGAHMDVGRQILR